MGEDGVSKPRWPRPPPKTLPRILELDKLLGAFFPGAGGTEAAQHLLAHHRVGVRADVTQVSGRRQRVAAALAGVDFQFVQDRGRRDALPGGPGPRYIQWRRWGRSGRRRRRRCSAPGAAVIAEHPFGGADLGEFQGVDLHSVPADAFAAPQRMQMSQRRQRWASFCACSGV